MSVRGVNKLSIIDAEAAGSLLAYASSIRGVARRAVLRDISATKVRAEALDLAHGSQFMPQTRVEGSEDPEITRGSDAAVIIVGAKQRPGETRMDLATSTVNLMEKVAPPFVERSPEAILLMVINPVNATTCAALKISGLPRNQLFGSGTVLGSSRLWYLAAEAREVVMANMHACITGEHGDSEIPLWSAATIGGAPLLDWKCQTGKLDESTRDSIADQVVNATYEMVAGKGATNCAIGLATTRIIEPVLRDEYRVLSVSSLVEDWYGIKDTCLSTPTIIGRQGVNHALRQPLTDNELGYVHESADAIRYTLSSLGF